VEGTAQGTVLALFARSAYLDLDGRVVALTSVEFGGGPLAIGLDRFRALRLLRPDADVSLDRGVLRVGACTIILTDAVVWNPSLAAVASGRGADLTALDVITADLRRLAPAGSIAVLADPLPGASAPADALIAHLRAGLDVIDRLLRGHTDVASATTAIATHIAGRGPGLTPSGDDLLCGIMHALTVWPHLASSAPTTDIRRLLADAARPLTTRISAAYLDAAARGHASEPWHVLVRSLGASLPAVRRAARRVLAVGETSGADALTGFCWMWRRLGT
jgi:hypothetical protein